MSVAKQPIALRWNHSLMLYCTFHALSLLIQMPKAKYHVSFTRKEVVFEWDFFSLLATTKQTKNTLKDWSTEEFLIFAFCCVGSFYWLFNYQLTIVLINQAVIDGCVSYIVCKSYMLLAFARFCYSRAWNKQNSGKKGIYFSRKRGVGETWHWVLTVLSYCQYEMRPMVLYYSPFYHCCCISVWNKVCCNTV